VNTVKLYRGSLIFTGVFLMIRYMSLIILMFGMLWLTAAEPSSEKGKEKSSTKKKVEQLTFLKKNVRLDFKRVPLEEEDQGTFIITASPAFNTLTRFRGDFGEAEFEVSGKLKLLDDGRILLAYEAYTSFDGHEEEGAEFHVASTVILQSNKELQVARMGDKILVIRASFEPLKAAGK